MRKIGFALAMVIGYAQAVRLESMAQFGFSMPAVIPTNLDDLQKEVEAQAPTEVLDAKKQAEEAQQIAEQAAAGNTDPLKDKAVAQDPALAAEIEAKKAEAEATQA